MAMLNLSEIKPRFWDHQDVAAGPGGQLFSFRRKWKLTVLIMAVVALTPLVVMALVDYHLTIQTFESETIDHTDRTVSSAGRDIALFLSQRRAALAFIARDNPRQALCSSERLATLLTHLRDHFGGFISLGVLDPKGRPLAYAGPHSWEGLKPGERPCFEQAVAQGFFVSAGGGPSGNDRQMMLAIRRDLGDGDFIILRATLDRRILENPISRIALNPGDDVFIINTAGLLQTSSRRYGLPFESIPLPVPEPAGSPRVMDTATPEGEEILMGYAYIPQSPFILMLVRSKSGIMDLWLKPRLQLIGFLVFSILLIMGAILGIATWLVDRIYSADQKRVQALHRVEYANKLASIGRLASGVAHEINNPLAIINQKVGLIKDLFTLKRGYAADDRMMGLVDDVLESIVRCSSITRRLLDFSRHMESRIEPVDLEAVIRQILDFMRKEVHRRHIRVAVETVGDIPELLIDRGGLQQIFLNLINNALAALADGGELAIVLARHKGNRVRVTVTDNGHGIPEDDIKRVFEPFFSTRHQNVGTGLGLSVTYGLVTEMGGDIGVQSRVGKGTCFTVTLPLHPPQKNITEEPGHAREETSWTNDQRSV